MTDRDTGPVPSPWVFCPAYLVIPGAVRVVHGPVVALWSILSSQQQSLQLHCCLKCLPSENGTSLHFQYCEFICNSIVWGTFPLTTYWRLTGFQFLTQILFFYSENNSDSLSRPPNINLIVVHWRNHIKIFNFKFLDPSPCLTVVMHSELVLNL